MALLQTRFILTFAGLIVSLLSLAQIPLLKEKSWVFTAGGITSIPVAPEYFDHSVTSGADYFWEYHVDPQVSLGWMTGLAHAQSLDIKKGFGYYELGIQWLAGKTQLNYNGWSGGGYSGILYHGSGLRSWTEHKMAFSGKLAHQLSLGKKNHEIINAICLSLEITLLETEHFVFDGEQSVPSGTSPFHSDTRIQNWIGSNSSIPDLKLYYEFGYVWRTKLGAWIPGFRTSFINFSNFIPQPFPAHEALRKREEYFKEISITLTWIPRILH